MSPIRPSKHAVLIETLPKALEGIDALRAAGRNSSADALQHVADYARDIAQAELDAADKRPSDNRALAVTPAFRTHVHAVAKAEGMNLADVVRKSLEDYLDGTWTPQVTPRAARGSGVKKVNLNVRVPDDLWNAVNEHAASQAHPGQTRKPTAASLSIAALEETFGLPDTEEATTGK